MYPPLTQRASNGQSCRARRPPSHPILTLRTPPFDPEVRSCDPEVCSFDPEDVIHLGHPSTAITHLHGVHARTIVPSLHTSTHIQPPHTRVHARSHVTTQGRSEDDRAHTHTSPRARRTPLCGVCEAPGSISPRSCGPHPVRHGFATESLRNFCRARRHPETERQVQPASPGAHPAGRYDPFVPTLSNSKVEAVFCCRYERSR